MGNIEDASESEDGEDKVKKPKPLKMTIKKSIPKKKKKRITDLNASDNSNDGDSGSDFILSEEAESKESEEEVESGSEDSEYAGRRGKKGRKGTATRRSTRDRKVRYDAMDDFVVDGSDSEDLFEAKKKKSVRAD